MADSSQKITDDYNRSVAESQRAADALKAGVARKRVDISGMTGEKFKPSKPMPANASPSELRAYADMVAAERAAWQEKKAQSKALSQ